MRAAAVHAALVLALALGMSTACDDDDPGSTGSAGRAGAGAGTAGATQGVGGFDSGAAGETALAPCLDRPERLERPPTGTLPCDLLPPGFGKR